MSMLMACNMFSVVLLTSFVRQPDSLGDDVVFVHCGIGYSNRFVGGRDIDSFCWSAVDSAAIWWLFSSTQQ